MGRSQAHQRSATAALRKIPNLPHLLKAELNGPNKYLALELISSLSLKSLMPELTRLSATDKNGAIHLTITSLIDEKNAAEIQTLFRAHLIEIRHQPLVVQVVLLDTLARFQTPLSSELLLSLFKSDASEMRLAVLNFINLQPEEIKKNNFKTVLDLGLVDSTESVRLRAEAIRNWHPR